MLLIRFLARLIVVLLVVYAIFFVSFGWPLPSDQDLIDEFEVNRAGYEEFVQRIRTATRQGEPLDDFKAAYLESLGIEYLCVQRHSQDEKDRLAFMQSVRDEWCRRSVGGFGVQFLTARRGFGVGTYGAGIAWLDETPEHYGSMDALGAAARKVEGFLGFRHIEDHWYLYLWEAD